jgi:predicted RNA-binding protein
MMQGFCAFNGEVLMKYWINTVSKEHALMGKKGGFIQAGHGKQAPLKRLRKGDYVVFYSPKTAFDGGEPLKAFTAVAKIKDENIYQVEMSKDFKPFRRNAEYEKCKEIKIEPLIEKLEFIKNKKSWGFKFRFGLFEINEHDFRLIYNKMKSKK